MREGDGVAALVAVTFVLGMVLGIIVTLLALDPEALSLASLH